MSIFDQILRRGIKALDKETTKFEIEYKNTSGQINKTKKEMEEWSKNRKINRNK
ncbi:MAG: hypothetical protein ACE3L7_07420 [Candidatus Pristimantibacillus sp.]